MRLILHSFYFPFPFFHFHFFKKSLCEAHTSLLFSFSQELASASLIRQTAPLIYCCWKNENIISNDGATLFGHFKMTKKKVKKQTHLVWRRWVPPIWMTQRFENKDLKVISSPCSWHCNWKCCWLKRKKFEFVCLLLKGGRIRIKVSFETLSHKCHRESHFKSNILRS